MAMKKSVRLFFAFRGKQGACTHDQPPAGADPAGGSIKEVGLQCDQVVDSVEIADELKFRVATHGSRCRAWRIDQDRVKLRFRIP